MSLYYNKNLIYEIASFNLNLLTSQVDELRQFRFLVMRHLKMLYNKYCAT